MFALWVFAPGAPAQSDDATAISGVYNGSYAGEQGPIKFKLAITHDGTGKLAGVFTLYLPEGSDTKAYACALTGFLHGNGTFLLARGQWETPPPSGLEIKAGLNGRFDSAGGNGAGQISGNMRDEPRPKFQAIGDADESAKLASAPTDKKDAGAPAAPAAPPERKPAAAKPAAPAPPSSSAPVST